MKRYYLILFFTTILITYLAAQISFAQSALNSETEKWPYVLPIWGDNATERGYKIQLPHGVMSNTYLKRKRF